MKVLCFILIAQIVLALTQPCDEIFPNVSHTHGSANQIARTDDRSTCDGSGAECSPFCLCSCCSHPTAAVMISIGVTQEYRSKLNQTVENEYTEPYTDAYRNSIWQPPKV